MTSEPMSARKAFELLLGGEYAVNGLPQDSYERAKAVMSAIVDQSEQLDDMRAALQQAQERARYYQERLYHERLAHEQAIVPLLRAAADACAARSTSFIVTIADAASAGIPLTPEQLKEIR